MNRVINEQDKSVDKIKMGQRIYELRKKCKLSQMQLGELIGITKNSVSNIELGKQICSSVNLECMARILGTTSIFLLYGKETIDSKNGNSCLEEEMLIEFRKMSILEQRKYLAAIKAYNMTA